MTTKRAAYGGWAGPESVPKTGSPPKITTADTALKLEKAQQMDLQQQMSATTKAAFVDELLKLSGSKWREMLRAGELTGPSVARLRQSGLLNHAREIAGLERGNQALIGRLGVQVLPDINLFGAGGVGRNVLKPSVDAAKQALKPGVQGFFSGLRQGKFRQAMNDLAAPLAAQAVNVSPATGPATLTAGTHAMISGTTGEKIKNFVGSILPRTDAWTAPNPSWVPGDQPLSQALRTGGNAKPELARRGLGALLTRHELDEVRASRKAFDRTKLFTLYRKQGEGLSDALRLPEGANPGSFRGRILGALQRGAVGAESHIPQLAAASQTAAHMSPRVFMEEAGHLNFMSPHLQHAWGAVRNDTGEAELAQNIGRSFKTLRPTSPVAQRGVESALWARSGSILPQQKVGSAEELVPPPVAANAGHYKQLAKNLAVILPATAVGAGLGHLAGTAVRNTDLGQQFLGNRWAGGIGPVVGATALTGGAVVLRHLLDQMGQEKIRAAGEDRARELATRSEG